MNRISLAQIMLALLICIPATAQPSRSDDQALSAGRAALEQHDYAKAIQVLEAGLKALPNSLAMKNELGRAYLYSRDDRRATRMFEEVLAADPNDRTANLELARILGYHHKYAASNARYREMLARNPNDDRASAGLIRNLIHQKQYVEANRELEAALRRNPQSPRLKSLHTPKKRQAAFGEGERSTSKIGVTESYLSDSGGHRALRSDQFAEFPLMPTLSNRVHLEEKRLWQDGVAGSSNLLWASDELKLHVAPRFDLLTDGGVVRFPDNNTRSTYRGAVELRAYKSITVLGGFGRSPFAPTQQAAGLNLTSEGWFTRIQGTPGKWRFAGGWSHQHLTDTNRSTREDVEIIRWIGSPTFSIAAGYHYDHAHFAQSLNHGYFSPDLYNNNLGITGIKFRPARHWFAEYLVKVGGETIGTSPLRAAYDLSLRNRIFLGAWEIDGTYAYYHIAQTTGAFAAHAPRVTVIRRF